MKNLIFINVYLFSIILLLTHCSSDKAAVKESSLVEKKEPVKVETKAVVQVETNFAESEPEMVIDIKERYVEELNAMQLSDYKYKEVTPTSSFMNQWQTTHISRLQEIINDIPDDHVLLITGHANAPKENLKKVTITNDDISIKRANTLADMLKNNGVSSSKLRTRGVGSSQPIKGTDPLDESNRRVTLKIIKK